MIRAYIGIGSNLADPRRQVMRAFDELAALPDTRLLAVSQLVKTPPMGTINQPDYINAVAALLTGLSADDLYDGLLAIEAAHGRVRSGERWGPRTLDLDLLLYGDAVIDDDRLTVPHPGMLQRNFVLYPLLEIAPDLEIPGHGRLSDAVAQCPRADLQVLADDAAAIAAEYE